MTKLTPFEVLTGHITSNPILDINLETQITNNYTIKHKDKAKILYTHIWDMNEKAKIKTLDTRNQRREEPPEIPKDVRIYTK